MLAYRLRTHAHNIMPVYTSLGRTNPLKNVNYTSLNTYIVYINGPSVNTCHVLTDGPLMYLFFVHALLTSVAPWYAAICMGVQPYRFFVSSRICAAKKWDVAITIQPGPTMNRYDTVCSFLKRVSFSQQGKQSAQFSTGFCERRQCKSPTSGEEHFDSMDVNNSETYLNTRS